MLLLAATPAAGVAQGPTPEQVRQRVREVLADERYQRDLPTAREPLRAAEMPEVPELPPVTIDPAAGQAVVGLAQVTLYLLLAVAAVLAVVWVARAVAEARERASASPGEAGPAGTVDREREPALADADRLAAAGRWAEAVHALLLIAARHLAARYSVPLAASSTSRELCRALPLAGEAREAFAGLVRTVEVSLFGGAAVGPDDYRSSLERCRRLLGGRG